MVDSDLTGIATLDVDAASVPHEGLSNEKHRVEFQRDGCDEAWIGEIIVNDALPWRRGESRVVGLRIMSTEFANEVRRARPVLVVMRGSNRVGLLKLDAPPQAPD